MGEDESMIDRFRRFTRDTSEFIFGEKRKDPNMVWTTAAGEKIFIPLMKTDHLQNCVRLMVRQAVCRWLGVMIQPKEDYLANDPEDVYDIEDARGVLPFSWHSLVDQRTHNMIKELKERSHPIDHVKYGNNVLTKARTYISAKLSHLPFTMKHLLGGV